MFKNYKILALIPARAGSKGIKNKNIISLCGKPLIGYTIETASKSKYIDEIIVSTDGEEIAKVAKDFGAKVPFLRPKELASDSAKTVDAVIHSIKELQLNGKSFDVLLLLQPTQPLRTAEEVDGAIEKFFEKGQLPLASISKVDDHPLLIRSIQDDGFMRRILDVQSTCRRQDMPEYYRINGAIYINKISEINENTSFNDNIVPYLMEKSHSVDIDEWHDLILAEQFLQKDKS